MEKRILQLKRALQAVLLFLLLSVVGMMKMHAITRATIGDLVYDLYGGDYAAVVVGHVDGQSATGNLDIPSTVTWNGNTYWVRGIGGNAFRDCSGLTGTLTIPNTVYNIEGGSFYGCSGFTELVFSQNPQYWIEIGNEAFAYCTGFTDLILSDHVQVIGSGAFAGCTGITIVSIPNSVIEMDHTAFNGTGWYNNQPNGILYLDGWCMGYKGAEPTGALNIAEGTRVVAGESFEGCIGITALTLPNSLKKIGKSAFSGCTGITGELIIPNSATYILENAFSRCTGFTGDLVIPDSVIYLGSCAFDSCSGFTGSLTLSNSLKKLKEGVFRGCSGFTGSLVIPNSVTQIGERQYAGTGTFEGCSGFTGSLTIGDSVTMIGRNAFNGCSGFTGELVIPDAVRDVGMYAFSGCSGFSGSLTLGASIDWVFCSAFRDCTGITTLNFNATQSGAFGVGYPAGGYFFWDGSPFEGCTSLTTLNIGDNVLTIPWCAFYGFNGFVGELVIPNSVTSIGDNAFSGCTGFTGDLVIPNSVTSIEKNAFWGCSSFTGELTLSNSLISIKEYSFEGCSGFTGELVIPSSVNDIRERAFHNCSGLTSVVIGDTTNPVEPITTIGAEAFLNCGALTSAVFGNSGAKIGDYAFHNCSSLTSVVIGDTINPVEPVTTIGASAFRDCTELTSIIIGNTVISIGPSAFYNTGYRNNHEDGIIYTPGNWCIGRKGVTLTDTLQLRENTRGIAGNVFNGCSGLTYVSFPDSLISIGVNAFMNCTGLTSVTIPSSMRFIGKRALCGCTGLTDLYFNAANCEIEEGRVVENNHWVYTYYWLYDCPSLSTVTLGDSVQVLSGNAFGACSSVTLLNVLAETPPLVTSLGDLNHDIPVHVPCGSLLAYQTIPIWNDFANIQQDNTCVFDITLIARGEEGGTVNGGGIYTSYQDCTMTAEANSGYVFTKWTKDGHTVSYNPSYTIVVTEDATYEAHFKPNSVSAHYYTNSEDPYCPYVCVSWTKANHAFFENYESGDFSSNDWQLDQTYPWTIYSAYPYEGRYCMKSGGGNYYTNNIQSTMQITVDIPKNGSISFAYKISSEEDYDGCAFYIDDQEMGFYSGLSGWEKKIYPITAGEHTLKWVYRKNQSRYRYDDCVYIDCIEFEGDGWYAYDNGASVDALGTGGGNIYWAVMFPPGSYEGNMLTKVSAYDAVAMQGNVTIYNGGTFSPTNPVGQRDISFTGVEDFVEFDFDNPVAIDPTKSVWVVFYNGSGTGYPAAVCNNTGDANGRWVNIDGNAWEDVKSFGLDYTFMVRAFITDGASGEYIAPMGLTTDWVAAQPTNSERGALRSRSGEISNGNVNQPSERSIRSLAPYYVYRANCEGGEMQLVADNVYESRFVDSAWAELPAGTYHYGICLENNANNIVWSNCIEKPDVSDTCVVKFDLFHPNGGGSSWFGNYLVVNYGGNTEILTKPGWEPVSYSIAMPKGCHVHLGWIYGNWTNSCGFTVSYENDNVIYTGSNIGDHGLAYEFVADCFNIPTYEITATANPSNGGTVSGAGSFQGGGSLCTLTAVANEGYAFVNWTENGNVVSIDEDYSFTVTRDRILVANFTEGHACVLNFDLHDSYGDGWNGNFLVVNYGNGNSRHLTITNGATASYSLAILEGSHVTLNWINGNYPEECSFTVSYGSGAFVCEGSNLGSGFSYEFDVDCTSIPTYEITVTTNPEDGGTISGAGVYDFESTCVLTAIANEGYAFLNWTENGNVVSIDESYSFTVMRNRTLVANYLEGNVCTLVFDLYDSYGDGWTGNKLVVSYGGFTQQLTLESGSSGSYSVNIPEGTHVTLSWINGNYTNECSFTISYENGYVTYQGVSLGNGTYEFDVDCSNFPTYEITATANPPDGGSAIGTGNYIEGTTCTLTATPNEGFIFLNWTINGTVVSTSSEYSFSVTEDAYCIANFETQGIVIGEGAATNSTLPSHSYYNYSLSQQIYTASEIGMGGSVIRLSFFNGGSTKTRNYDIYMVHTDKTEFESETDWIAVNTTDLVFSGNVTMTEGCWTTITLDTPFEYNGVSNMALIVDDNTGSYSSGMACRVYDAQGHQAIRRYSDGTDYDPINPSSYDGTLLSVKNQIILKGIGCFIINAVADPPESGTFMGAGIYDLGATATLTAMANEGYTFINWTKDGEEVSTNATYTFTVTENADYVANFSQNSYTISASASPSNGGTVSGGGSYNYGSNCTLTASPNTGYTFTNWTKNGQQVSTSATYSFTVTEAGNYVANFSQNSYTISATASPSNGGTVSGGGSYNHGASCTLTASPNTGYTFTNWTKNGQQVSTSASYTFTVTENASYMANFDLGYITQSTSFTSGWNWYSTYIEQEGINGLQMLEAGLGSSGIQIKSQQQYVNYYEGMGWMGMLDAINNESSYKIKTSVPCVVEITGNETSSATHPINIGPGWNWIGYPVNASMSVTTAMSSITPTNGDQLKAQNGYANYYEGMGWMGTLSTIEPGMGLLYKSNNSQNITLVYPTGAKGETLAKNITSENNHWVPNMHAYPDNMTVTAVVELDDVELTSDSYELAAFANGECRGSVRLMYIEPLNHYVAFLTVVGEDVETLTFSLYDTTTGEEVHGANEQINFINNATLGDIMEPYVLHFRGITGTDEWANNIHVFPNPVTRGENVSLSTTEEIGKVQIEVINTLGIVVETLRATSVQTIAAPNVAGVYTLRITAEGKRACYRKLVVK